MNCAASSPDGLRVVTSGNDQRVRVWDAGTHLPLTEWLRSDVPVAGVWFSDDGSRVLSDGGMSWQIQTFQGIAPKWLPDFAEAVAGKRLNHGQDYEAADPAAFAMIAERLDSENASDRLTAWARQFIANVRQRPPPGSPGGL